ncbi:MAG: PASTA domain-containing protein [Ruminococcus sp.]|nr:PASTA domain-containing protein [Ruminococcus sp.]
MGANQRLRQRTVWLLIIILVVGFGAVITRLAFLQLVQGEELQQKAVDQQLSDTTVRAKRGTIYDRNGKVLAQSASVWQVVMSPASFKEDVQREYVASELAEILGLEYEDVLEKTKQDTYYSVVKRKIESAERDKVLELMNKVEDKYELSSVIALLDDYKRYYPYNSLASSVIGFTGSEDQGLSGVEYQYNEYLTGTPGRLITATNANGSIMPFDYSQNVEAIDGNSVVLTIDETIQSIIEKHMQQGIKDYDVYNRGVAIAMDVNNGEILGMATIGGYNLNDPFTISKEDQKKINAIDREYLLEKGYMTEEDNLTGKEVDELIGTAKSEAESMALSQMWRNKAISDTYYPGSVFKMVTLSMALEENEVNKKTKFGCSGYYQLYDKKIGCHNTAGHGTQNYTQALCNSCNPAFIQIGDLIGVDRFWQYYQAFGFSEKTGIDLPGESDDLFFTEDGSMGPVDLAVASFGQNFSITPIQMITAASAIANGGDVVQPHVVKQILGTDGSVVKNISTDTKRQVISKAVSDEMCRVLEVNAIEGTGKNGYVAGYRIAGKTGTSEKLTDSNGDFVQDYIASYCGFAPADNPEVAVLVFFDTPLSGNYYGSAVAAPVFASIMGEILPYLELEAQYTEKEAANIDTTAGTYTGLSVSEATKIVNSDGFDVTIKGEGTTVVAQVPAAGSKIPQGGTVVLYTDEDSVTQKVTVPNLVGFSLYDVNYLASYYGINVSLTGTVNSSDSTSISQDIAEGTSVSPGTVVTVAFSTSGVND